MAPPHLCSPSFSREEEYENYFPSIQIATSIYHGATGFLTNDRTSEKVKGIDTGILEKFLK